MNSKKINTVPNGTILIITIVFEIILTLMIGLSLLPEIEAIGVFSFTLMFCITLIYYLILKHWNFIEVSKEGISHRQDRYNWGNVFITVKCSSPIFSRKSFDYYAFFDDHFLTDEEIASKVIKRKGFYMILTEKRIKNIFMTLS